MSNSLRPHRQQHAGLPWCLSDEESACQYSSHGFIPWVGKILWRRKWQPTPVFLPRESHGRRSLVGCSPWGSHLILCCPLLLLAPIPPRIRVFSNEFQMFKLVLEKAEEPEIKLPTSAGSWKKEESSRKTSISALLTMPKPLTVWITINCGKF